MGWASVVVDSWVEGKQVVMEDMAEVHMVMVVMVVMVA